MILVNGRQISITTFPNKERKITLPTDAFKGENKRIVVVWQYEDDGDFLLINMVNDLLEQNGVDLAVECLILSLPYERMDRSENGNVFSLKVAAGLLPEDWSYTLVSPHSNVAVQLFTHSTWGTLVPKVHSALLDVITFARPLIQRKLTINNELVLVFPDKGAFQRYAESVASSIGLPIDRILYGNKSRDFDSGQIQQLILLEENGDQVTSLEGKDVIVVDDLSSYGGTFVRLHRELKRLKADKTFLILEKTEDSIVKGDLPGKYDGIYTTDLMMNIMIDPTYTPEIKILSKHEIIRKLTKNLGGFN